MAHENVIEMHEITKIFGEFVANDKINLNLRRGEIHALLGENGAGKSTLMNMLAGLLEPTSGEITVNGKSVTIDSPSKSASLGIGMVHQHFMLVEAFTVAENIILGSETTRNGVLDIRAAIKDIKELSEKYGLAVDPTAKVEDISVGAQQRVEILKTLYYEIKPLAPEDAKLKLEERPQDKFLTFINLENNKVNVIYRLKDGKNFGIVEPEA